MALFDSLPLDSEAVSLGASRIRSLKSQLNATLGLIFSDYTVPTWVTNIIPGASLVNASISALQLAAGAVTASAIAPGAVTAAGSVPDAFYYGDGSGSGSYILSLSPAPASLVPGMVLRFRASAANAGASTLAVTSRLVYFGPGSPGVGSPIASLTSAAGVATVTTTLAHGLTTGNLVSMAGASVSGYNLSNVTITVTSTTAFTYAVASGLASPAVVNTLTSSLIYFGPGSPTVGSPISALTSTGTTATITTASAHGLTTGNLVTVKGAAVSGYNVLGVSITVTGSTTFTYTVVSGLASPAVVPTAPSVVKFGSLALSAGDFAQNQIAEVAFDGTSFQVISTTANIVDGSSVILAKTARAWVNFDGSLSIPHFTASGVVMTLNAAVTQNGSPITLPNGQAVTLTTTGTLPSSLVQGTTYYVASAGSSTTYHLYLAAVDALAANSNFVTFTGGSGTHSMNSVLIRASNNVAAVIRTFGDGGGSGGGWDGIHSTYEVIFSTPMVTGYASIGTAAALGNAYQMTINTANSDPGVTGRKRLWSVGAEFGQTASFFNDSNEVNVVFFSN